MRKKLTVKIGVVAFACIGLLLLSAIPAFAAQKKVLFRCQHYANQSLPIIGESVVWMAEKVKEASGGEINIKVYDAGKLVPPMEIFEAVSSGQIESGIIVPGFYQGKASALTLFSCIPFGPEVNEYLAWYYYGDGKELFEECNQKYGFNMVMLPVFMNIAETSGWFTKPINSPKDLKGLRMRFFGLGGHVMEKLGVSVSQMAPGELYQSLEKGVLDGTEFSSPSIDERLGFHKICKYNYYPGWHQQCAIIYLAINKKKWDALTPTQQALIEMCSYASTMNSIALGEGTQGKVVKENVEVRGVNNMYWSDEMLATFKKAWEEVAAEKVADDPFFEKVYDDLVAFRAEYQYWKDDAFLPRNCDK